MPASGMSGSIEATGASEPLRNNATTSIAVYTCGINTLVLLSAIYAQEVIAMTSTEIVALKNPRNKPLRLRALRYSCWDPHGN